MHFKKFPVTVNLMKKMFRSGIVSIVMCLRVSVVNLKADFEADLRSILSPERFPQKNHEDPILWGEYYELYKDCKRLYGDFRTHACGIIKKHDELRKSKTIRLNGRIKVSDGAIKDALCFLCINRDLYDCVSDYADKAEDLMADFDTIDGIVTAECYGTFVRRMFGIAHCCIREFAKTLRTDWLLEEGSQQPCDKILAELMKSFAKRDAYDELAKKDNDSPLVQNVNIFQKSFETCFRRADSITADAKEKVNNARSPNEKLRVYAEMTGDLYGEAVRGLKELSEKVLGQLERMCSILGKVSEEDFKAASLKDLKRENSDICSDASEKFRAQEKAARKQAQEDFKGKKEQKAKYQYGIIEKIRELKKLRKEQKKLLKDMQKNDKPQDAEDLGDEIDNLTDKIDGLKKEINEFSRFSVRVKRRMERKAAVNCISGNDRKAALLANYTSLPGKCDGYRKTFFYYDTLMRNFCRSKIEQLDKYNQWYDVLEIEKPMLTDDFEEEYISLSK